MNSRRFLSHATTRLMTVLIGTWSASGMALPLGSRDDHSAGLLAPSEAEMAASDVDFTAIVALNNCSGALVRFTQSKPEDKAIVMTNGHCYEGGFIDPGKVVLNEPSTRAFRLLNSKATANLGILRATKVIYATMTGTDITLYRVDKTYGEIESEHGVQALTLAEHRPDAQTPIRVVSGYWKKIYACQIESFVPQLKEDKWVFTDAIRYSRPGCETIGGTSGSPIIHADTKEIIGINNTSNTRGERCTMDNPCEVDAEGQVTATKGVSYGQETYIIYGCLTAENQLDLNLPSCKLAKPAAARHVAHHSSAIE